MFIMIQFPFADLRYLSPEETHQLDIIRNMNSIYGSDNKNIRCFGSVKERSDSENVIEPIYCSSKKAFSFDPYNKDNQVVFTNNIIGIHCKRLFVNKIFCKLDVGIQCKTRIYPYSYFDIEKTIYSLYKLKIIMRKTKNGIIRNRKEERKTERLDLKDISKRIPDYYLFSTTNYPKINFDIIKHLNLIQSAKPVVIIELFDDEFIFDNIPSNFRIIKIKEWDLTVCYYNSKRSDTNIGKVWIIVKNLNSHMDKIRNLRIYLQIFHQQYECIELILGYLNQSKIKYDFKTLNQYIRPYLANFLSESYYGIQNNMIIDLFFDVEKVAFPNYKEQLLEKCAGTCISDVVQDIMRENEERVAKKNIFRAISQIENEIDRRRSMQLEEGELKAMKELTQTVIELKADLSHKYSPSNEKAKYVGYFLEVIKLLPSMGSFIINLIQQIQ